ncbi:MAG: hypothetical protein ACXW34_07020 [Nitrospira sp.]
MCGLAVTIMGIALALPAQARINVMEKGDSCLDLGMLLDIQARHVENEVPNMGISDGMTGLLENDTRIQTQFAW